MERWLHTTPSGNGYFLMSDYDIQEICGQCRAGEDDEVLIRDCNECVLPVLVTTLKEYAERIDMWEEDYGNFY